MTPAELRAERQRLGLTLKQTGQALGVHWMTVWKWEHGIHPVPRAVQLVLEAAEREPK